PTSAWQPNSLRQSGLCKARTEFKLLAYQDPSCSGVSGPGAPRLRGTSSVPNRQALTPWRCATSATIPLPQKLPSQLDALPLARKAESAARGKGCVGFVGFVVWDTPVFARLASPLAAR